MGRKRRNSPNELVCLAIYRTTHNVHFVSSANKSTFLQNLFKVREIDDWLRHRVCVRIFGRSQKNLWFYFSSLWNCAVQSHPKWGKLHKKWDFGAKCLSDGTETPNRRIAKKVIFLHFTNKKSFYLRLFHFDHFRDLGQCFCPSDGRNKEKARKKEMWFVEIEKRKIKVRKQKGWNSDCGYRFRVVPPRSSRWLSDIRSICSWGAARSCLAFPGRCFSSDWHPYQWEWWAACPPRLSRASGRWTRPSKSSSAPWSSSCCSAWCRGTWSWESSSSRPTWSHCPRKVSWFPFPVRVAIWIRCFWVLWISFCKSVGSNWEYARKSPSIWTLTFWGKAAFRRLQHSKSFWGIWCSLCAAPFRREKGTLQISPFEDRFHTAAPESLANNKESRGARDSRRNCCRVTPEGTHRTGRRALASAFAFFKLIISFCTQRDFSCAQKVLFSPIFPSHFALCRSRFSHCASLSFEVKMFVTFFIEFFFVLLFSLWNPKSVLLGEGNAVVKWDRELEGFTFFMATTLSSTKIKFYHSIRELFRSLFSLLLYRRKCIHAHSEWSALSHELLFRVFTKKMKKIVRFSQRKRKSRPFVSAKCAFWTQIWTILHFLGNWLL